MRHELATVILSGYTKCQPSRKRGMDESDDLKEGSGKVERIANHRREEETVREKRGGTAALNWVR